MAIFLSLVHRTDLILHILIELNGLHALASVSVMLGHSKNTKMPFWMIQNAKNGVLTIFWSLVCWSDLILHIMKALHALQHSALGGPEFSFKNHENASLIDPKGQKKVFVHFKDFGQLDRVHIAYFDNEYCLLASSSATRSLGFIQKSQNSMFN